MTNEKSTGSFEVKVALAEMLKGGVIMDVTTLEQAKIAEDAGASAVMALERIPSDIRAQGGVARMSPPDLIQKIQVTGYTTSPQKPIWVMHEAIDTKVLKPLFKMAQVITHSHKF